MILMHNVKLLQKNYHWACWLLVILLITILILLSNIMFLAIYSQKEPVYYASTMDGSLTRLYSIETNTRDR